MHFQTTAAFLSVVGLIPFVFADCSVPDDAGVWNTDSDPHSVIVYNTTRPEVHRKAIQFTASGGGDQILFLEPTGTPQINFTLDAGVWKAPGGLRAIVSGQVDGSDGTSRIFFTARDQSPIMLEGYLSCDPDGDSDDWQAFFRLSDGGKVCVRPDNGRYDLRFKPDTAISPGCIEVTLAKIPKLWDA
ncbi:hypothetical protein EDC01DRAFT_7182 [Geopyxis carbonaria]|nr:hypothetical protein EDC01DRAFT_7182 [Geopyxis carbonaria]